MICESQVVGAVEEVGAGCWVVVVVVVGVSGVIRYGNTSLA
jgi:hypothetical protein